MFLFRARDRKPPLELRLDYSRNHETRRPRGCCCKKWRSSRRAGHAVAVRGVRNRVSGGSRVDTLKETSENATDPRGRSRNTYLVPSRGTVDTHRFADITVTRLEDATVIVSRHVPVALDKNYQGPSISDNIHKRGVRTPITS